MRNSNLYPRNGIWWLRATVGGRAYRESLRTSDAKIARKRRDARLAEIKGAVHFGEREVSWHEAVTEWAEQAHNQIAPKTALRYSVSLQQVDPYLSRYTVDRIDGKAIADMIAARQKAGATAATIRRDLTAVSRVLEYAEGRHWREGNPTLSKRRILKERRDPITLPREEDIDSVLAVASPLFDALMRAARLTGCRQGELVKVTWDDFSHNRGTLSVVGKKNKRRTIQLSAEAAALIAALPRHLASDLIFNRDGLSILQAASDFTHLRREAEKRAKREGREFRRFRFHDLRHLFAVEALRAGMSIYNLSKHLGHTSVKTTEIYLEHLTPEQQEHASRGTAQIPAHKAGSR